MRICLVLGRCAALTGAPDRLNYVRRAARALLEAEHQVHILADAQTIAAGLGLDARAQVHPTDSMKPSDAAGYPHPAYAHAMSVRTALARLHEAEPFDAVEFSTGFGEGYFTVRNKRSTGMFSGVVLAARAWVPDQAERSSRLDERLVFETAMADHAQLAVLREADVVLTPTIALAASITPALEHGSVWGLPVVCPVGTPIEPPAEATPPAPAPFKRLVFTGPLAHERGCLALAQAAGVLGASVPGLAFLGPETGAGPYARPMRPLLVRALGRGHAEFFDLPDAGDDDLVCVPTRADAPEAAMLDSALAGRAAITGDSAGMKEVFGPAAVLSSDPLAFAAELSGLLADPKRVHELRRGARDAARAFADPKRFADAFERAVQSGLQRAAETPTGVDVKAPSGITAVVPVYNGGKYLRETIDAIRAQTLAPEAILVVDDGSTDEATIALVAQLEHEGLTVLRKPNGGVGSARNLGVRAATTPLVALIDSDDLPEPEFFAKAAALLRSTPTLSYASALPSMFEHDDTSTGAPRWIPLGLPGFDEELLLCRNSGGLGGGTLFIREHLIDAGGYDESLPSYEDWDLWCRLAGRGRKGIVIPEFLVLYRVHAASKYTTVGLPNHERLKSVIIARHGHPPLLTDRTLRFEFGEQAELRAGLEYARTAHERAEAAAAQVEAKFQAHDKELARSTEWNNVLQQELDRAVDSNRTLQERYAALDEQMASSTRWNNTLQGDLDRTLESLRSLQAQFNAQERTLIESAEWNNALQARLDARESDLEHIRAAAESLRERLAGTTDQNVYLMQLLSAAQLERQTAEDRAAAALTRARHAEGTLAGIDRAADARALVRENMRYRAADALNDALKRLYVQRMIKALVGRGGAEAGTRVPGPTSNGTRH